jgi:hypothetical protein
MRQLRRIPKGIKGFQLSEKKKLQYQKMREQITADAIHQELDAEFQRLVERDE